MPKSAICSYTTDSSNKKTYEDSSWSTRTEIVLVKTRCTSSGSFLSSAKRKQKGQLPSLTCSPFGPQTKQLATSCRKQRNQACKASWLQNNNVKESIVLSNKRQTGNLSLLEKLDRLDLSEKIMERAYHTLLRNNDLEKKDAKNFVRSMLSDATLSKSSSLEEKRIDIDGKQTKRPKEARRFSTCSMPKLIQGTPDDVTKRDIEEQSDTGMDTLWSRASKLMTNLSLESLTNSCDQNEVLSSTSVSSIASEPQIRGNEEIHHKTELMDPTLKPNRLKMRTQRYSTGMCPDLMKLTSHSINNADSVKKLCSLPGSLSFHPDNQAKRQEICEKKRKLFRALGSYAAKDSSALSY